MSSTPVVPRSRAYAGLSAAAALLLPIVAMLGREPLPTRAALVALALEVLLLGGLAMRERAPLDRPGRAATLLLPLAALLLAPVGWFFGPNAGIAAFVSLLVLSTGVLSRPGPGGALSVAVYLALAGGQLLVVVLVLARVLPDLSLAPVIVPGHPDWQHLFAHLATQGIHLGSFLAGRSLRARYDDVQLALESSLRGAALQDVLLDEARADYRRALRAAQRGAVSPDGHVRRSVPPAALPAPVSVTPPAPSAPKSEHEVTATTALWMDAYRTRMRGQHLAVLALCVSGSAILGAIGRNPVPLALGLSGMTLIALLTVLQRERAERRKDESSYWPWALIAGLSVLPAYAFGLHSAFACVIAALLFVGGSFRAAPGEARVGRRLPVLLAVVVAHGSLFALVWAGVVADDGNLAILSPGSGPFEPLVLHLLLEAAYAASFSAGVLLDARFEAAIARAERARLALEGGRAELSRAGEGIARAVHETGEGLLSGQAVGRYALGRLLASGAMGDVYAARDAGGRDVAVKLVRPDRASEPEVLEILAREARTLSRIESPAVARVLEAGVDEELPFVAMELIDGESLADVLRDRGRLSLAEARELARDLFRGVRDVHEAGVVHRDLKPHNVMRLRRESEDGPRWKVVDFGLALEGASGRELLGGTPAYMAPEQALGERVDPRADLYSASLVLFRALTGRPAFVGSDAVEVAMRARTLGPPDPSRTASLPPDLVSCLRIGLAAHPADRFTTAREAASAFDRAFEGALDDRHRERARSLLGRAPWAG